MKEPQTIATGLGFVEGPVFTQDGGIVVVSCSGGTVHRIDPDGGGASLLAHTRGGPNGAAEAADGSIYIAQNGRGWPYTSKRETTGGVQVIRPDGTVDYLTADPVSPNDLCFGPDGFLYVTDPSRPMVKSDGRIWRVDVTTGEADLLISVPWYPNGIGFGLADDVLCVANSTHGQIVRYPLSAGTLGPGEVLVQVESGHPDGFDFDTQGNLVIAVPTVGDPPDHGEVQTWTPDGRLLDVQVMPAPSVRYTNLALNENRQLIITDSDAGSVLLFEDWPAAGLPLWPFRS